MKLPQKNSSPAASFRAVLVEAKARIARRAAGAYRGAWKQTRAHLTWRKVRHFGLAALSPFLAGALAELLSREFGVTQPSFLFMTSVIVAGAFFGSAPALLAAIIAFVIYNFFLVEPRFSLRLASADDFFALLLFLAAAIVTGGLAGRLRDQSETARIQLRTTQALFEASQRLANAIEAEPIFRILAENSARALNGVVLVLWAEAPQWRLAQPSGGEGADVPLLQRIASDGRTSNDEWMVAPMQGQGGMLGALALRAAPGERARYDEQTLQSLASLGAVALERSALIGEMTETRALAQSERLRAALLSSLSHDFRTPLAAILASSTSLLEYGATLDELAKADLMRSIRDESRRLNRYVASLLDMSRLEAGTLTPRATATDIREVALDAAAHANAQATRNVTVTCAGPVAIARADPVLLEQALMNVLENAIAFSPSGGTVRIDIAEGDTPTLIVSDDGPGLSPEDKSRVFEKFYRSPQHAERRKGVGLGLAITKGLVEAMGGTIAADAPIDANGARFVISLKKARLG